MPPLRFIAHPRLVETGTHFELKNLWQNLAKWPEHQFLNDMLSQILRDDNRWDLEEIRVDLNNRSFNNSFINSTLMQRIRNFREQLD